MHTVYMDAEKSVFVTISSAFRRPSGAFLLLLVTVISIFCLQMTTKIVSPIWAVSTSAENGNSADPSWCSGFLSDVPPRKTMMSITDFGGVGDGMTSNTETFRRAIGYLKRFGDKGGSQLNVPRGRWVTGSFNLTSNFTLFLQEGAVILGSQV